MSVSTHMIRWFAALFIILAAALSWAGQARPVIKPGDMLRLICQEESSINRDYRVTTDGLILVDFLGAVKVEGLTESEAADKVAKQLQDEKILKKATIKLQIISPDAKMVRFGGALKLQGETPWRANMHLSDLLRLAEPLPETDLSRVQIKSANLSVRVVDATKAAPEGDPILAAGDELTFFKKSDPTTPATNPNNPPAGDPTDPVKDPVVQPNQNVGTVAVRGQVMLTGDYPFASGLTVGELLIKAGGFLPGADTSSIELVRNGAKSILRLPLDKDFVLESGDRLTVTVQAQPKATIEVRGSVRRPGKYEIVEGTPLSEVIEMAGGFMDGARTDRIKIFSPANEKPREVNFEDIVLGYRGDISMRPGQTVEIDGPKPPSLDMNLSKKQKIAAGALAFLLLFGF